MADELKIPLDPFIDTGLTLLGKYTILQEHKKAQLYL